MSTLRARVLQRLILACWMATSVALLLPERLTWLPMRGSPSKLLKVADDLIARVIDIK